MRCSGLIFTLGILILGGGLILGSAWGPFDGIAYYFTLVGILFFVCGLYGAFCWMMGISDCDRAYRELTVEASVLCKKCRERAEGSAVR